VSHSGRCMVELPALVALILLACAAGSAQASPNNNNNNKKFRFPTTVPAPANNKVNPQQVRLGEMLFFDPRLSGSNWISCATCHNPTWDGRRSTDRDRQWHDCSEALHSIHRQYRF
jgi:cytochrome c peroxidase